MQSFTRNSTKTCGPVSKHIQIPDQQLLILIFFLRTDTDDDDMIICLLTGSRDQHVQQLNYGTEWRYFAPVYPLSQSAAFPNCRT